MVAAHLHNNIAKKPGSNDYKQFFDILAELCAGGGRIVGADLNMAAFNAVEEMAKRGVGLTLLNHHSELADPNGPYDEKSVLFDSMGLWIVGKFDIEKTRIATAAEHIFWGAAHPKEVASKQYRCGYRASSYKHTPPRPQVVNVDGLNSALAELRVTIKTYEADNEECRVAFGVPPQCRVRFPIWLVQEDGAPEKRPTMLWFLEDDTDQGRVPIAHDLATTWMRPRESRTPAMEKTDDFQPLPACQEIVAMARLFYDLAFRILQHWPWALPFCADGKKASREEHSKKGQGQG